MPTSPWARIGPPASGLWTIFLPSCTLHGACISDARLISDEDGQVTIRIKDYEAGDTKLVTYTGAEFVRRFVLHILPRTLGCTVHSQPLHLQRAGSPSAVQSSLRPAASSLTLLADSAQRLAETALAFVRFRVAAWCSEKPNDPQGKPAGFRGSRTIRRTSLRDSGEAERTAGQACRIWRSRTIQ